MTKMITPKEILDHLNQNFEENEMTSLFGKALKPTDTEETIKKEIIKTIKQYIKDGKFKKLLPETPKVKVWFNEETRDFHIEGLNVTAKKIIQIFNVQKPQLGN